MATTLKLTYDDYLGFPDDGRRHQLVDGEHEVTPAPSLRHQAIVLRLARILAAHIEAAGSGWLGVAPVDVLLSDVDVVQPDLVYVAEARSPIFTDANLRGAPDLVVEIVSESTRRLDEVTKRHLYAKHGVGEYWVIDPLVERVKIYRGGGFESAAEFAAEAASTLTSSRFPGLEILLADLFR